jgi:hypothetical protein
MKSILFFDPSIKINVHSALHCEDVGRTLSIEEFAGNDAVALYELENGDYRIVAMPNKRSPLNARFIEGAEV